MEIKWAVGDICRMNTYARRDIKVQIKTYMIIGPDVLYIVEETLAPFEKHICFENDLYEVGWG